jgi:hypothetical protein
MSVLPSVSNIPKKSALDFSEDEEEDDEVAHAKADERDAQRKKKMEDRKAQKEANTMAEAEGGKSDDFAKHGGGGKSSGKDARKALREDMKAGKKPSW